MPTLGQKRTLALVSIFLENIRSGKWGIGEAIPPTRELMEEYGYSVNVVTSARQNLCYIGILEVRIGTRENQWERRTYVKRMPEKGW